MINTMPTYTGYSFHNGGYSHYLNGKDRMKYLKTGVYDVNDEHALESTDPQVKPDEGTNLVQPYDAGVPVNAAVTNEISIDSRSREHQRLVGLTNSNPVSMDMNKRANITTLPNDEGDMTVKPAKTKPMPNPSVRRKIRAKDGNVKMNISPMDKAPPTSY